MAPKADSKAKAKPKADAKAKAARKEKKEVEEEVPRMSQPEWDDAAFQKIQDAIDGLAKQVQGCKDQMKGKGEGREEYFEEKKSLQGQRDEIKKELDRLQENKGKIEKELENRQQQSREMAADVSKMKKTIGYTSEAAIDQRIADLEFKMWTESLKLKDEKAIVAELQMLKKNKSKVSDVSQKEAELSNFKASTDPKVLKEQKSEINAEMAEWRKKRDVIDEKRKALEEARKAKEGDRPAIQEKLKSLQEKLQEKLAEKRKFNDDFKEQNRLYRTWQAEQRRIRAEKQAEERKAWEEEKRRMQVQRKVEQMDEQPHVTEITLIEQCIKFCKSKLPKEVDQKAEEKKEVAYNNNANETVLLSKDKRDEEFYFCTTAKKGKQGKKTKQAPEESKKAIKHDAETFQIFKRVNIDTPVTVADIPACLEKLEEKLEMYLQKVKDWEANKETLKAKMLAGEVDVDDVAGDKKKAQEKEEEKEEEKEPEKEEEVEEAKEEEKEDKEEEKEEE